MLSLEGNLSKYDIMFQETTVMMNRDFPLATQNKTTTSEFLLRKLHEKDDKSTINSSGRDRMVVLDQHIKFLEGNYSVTITVSWERQT